MEWTGEGILLSVRRHGESAALIEVFTPEQGRHAGLVRGGAGRRLGPVLQPGAQVHVRWRARLGEHTGTFTVEPLRARLGLLTGDRLALTGLQTVCALLVQVLPERAAYPRVHAATETLLDLMPQTEAWPVAYLRWEMGLLEAMGVGLDLSRCAVTGARTGLAYVSPRTGRAVTAVGAGELAPKLLALPPCMTGTAPASMAEIATALRTTGHFFAAHLGRSEGGPVLPGARARLIDLLARGTE